MRFLSILAFVLFAPALAVAQEPQAEQPAREPFVTPLTPEEMRGKQALIETDLGAIAIDLRPELAPNHVGLVMRLAADGAFDGTTFHSMVRHGIVQGVIRSRAIRPGPPITAAGGRAWSMPS